jgi:hypothetical protein
MWRGNEGSSRPLPACPLGGPTEQQSDWVRGLHEPKQSEGHQRRHLPRCHCAQPFSASAHCICM